MKKALVLFALLFVSGCDFLETKKPEPIEGMQRETQLDYSVEFLFETDGVKIYKFYDEGKYRYFATKGGTTLNQTQTKTRTYRNGKTVNTTRTHYDSGVIDADFGDNNDENL